MVVRSFYVRPHDGWSELYVLVTIGEDTCCALYVFTFDWEDRDGDTDLLWKDEDFAEPDVPVDALYACERWDEIDKVLNETAIV